MKKLGFTIAELLIAMVVLGVIAIMVVPSFIANVQGRQNSSGFKKAISSINEVLQQEYAITGNTAASQNLGEDYNFPGLAGIMYKRGRIAAILNPDQVIGTSGSDSGSNMLNQANQQPQGVLDLLGSNANSNSPNNTYGMRVQHLTTPINASSDYVYLQTTDGMIFAIPNSNVTSCPVGNNGNILQQASQSMLAQANSSPQQLLQAKNLEKLSNGYQINRASGTNAYGTQTCGIGWVDVNGNKAPNTSVTNSNIPEDRFAFAIYETQVLPGTSIDSVEAAVMAGKKGVKNEDNISDAESQIRDTDMAQEMVKYPQGVLQLLQ